MMQDKSIEFVSHGDPRSLKTKWQAYIIMLAIFMVPLVILDHSTHKYIDWGVGIVLWIVMVVSVRYEINVLISKEDNTFTYHTMDCFGIERNTIVDITSATVKYTYGVRGKYQPNGWKLKLYNSYFKNRIVIYENEKTGYDRGQLDEMVDIINGLKKS